MNRYELVEFISNLQNVKPPWTSVKPLYWRLSGYGSGMIIKYLKPLQVTSPHHAEKATLLTAPLNCKAVNFHQHGTCAEKGGWRGT